MMVAFLGLNHFIKIIAVLFPYIEISKNAFLLVGFYC